MFDYFSQALSLRRQYDVYKAFTAAGIQPGDKASSDQFSAAASKAFGRGITLRCNGGKITEVMLYFTASGRTSYKLTDPPRSGNRGCGGQVLWVAKSGSNGTDSGNPNSSGERAFQNTVHSLVGWTVMMVAGMTMLSL
jgi:ribonuclease T2